MIDPLWTLDAGVALARRLEAIAIPHNAHIALGGSVLHSGASKKDLDIFVYPRKTAKPFTPKAILKAFGVADIIHRNAGYTFDGDAKQVFVGKLDGKRVDFFFLK